MSDPWQVLRRAGLPLGMPDPTEHAPNVDELAGAVRLAVASDPVGRPRDALCALILAWKRQWPVTFARMFDSDGAAIAGWARSAIADPNRHIKLSRIAMAHLASVL